MSIDDKLYEVLDNLNIVDSLVDEIGREDLRPEQIRRIKQAFIDEGWRHNLAAGFWTREAEREGLMTGQEWYDRFEQEVNKWRDAHLTVAWPSVQESAKRAAGIKSANIKP